jgi:hypothetical protein
MKLEEVQENHQKILQMEVENELPDFQIEMVQQRAIKEALCFRQCRIDQKLFYRYALNGMRSIWEVFQEGRATITTMKSIMIQLVDLLEKKTDYLLGDNQILWEPQWLYWKDGQMHVVVVPDGATDEKSSLYRLIEFFMEVMDTDNREQVLFVYGLYRLLKENEDFFLLLKQYVKEELPEPVKLPPKEKPKQIIVKQKEEKSKIGILTRLKQLRKPKEDAICWSDETVVLTPTMSLTYLTPTSGCGSNLSISGFPYIIGKNVEQANGVINNESVSRIHGKIYEAAGKLYYMDQNSTNGTYLNGERLPAYEECEIKTGDCLQFGTVEYRLT